jgi:hypothetical protein
MPVDTPCLSIMPLIHLKDTTLVPHKCCDVRAVVAGLARLVLPSLRLRHRRVGRAHEYRSAQGVPRVGDFRVR